MILPETPQTGPRPRSATRSDTDPRTPFPNVEFADLEPDEPLPLTAETTAPAPLDAVAPSCLSVERQDRFRVADRSTETETESPDLSAIAMAPPAPLRTTSAEGAARPTVWTIRGGHAPEASVGTSLHSVIALPPERAHGVAIPLDPAPAAQDDLAPRSPTPAAPLPTVGTAHIEPHSSDLVLRATEGPAWQMAVAPRRSHHVAAAAPAARPEGVVGQLAVAIAKATDARVEIRLDPPELGRVQIHLTSVEGGVQALVLAQRPETHDLLRRHAELLLHELAGSGFGSVSLDFASGGDSAPHDRTVTVDHFAVAGPIAEAPLGPWRATADGLDIRV